jgi:hypothetical protein
VEVRLAARNGDKEPPDVKGELLAVENDHVFVLERGAGVRTVAREEIESVRVELHELGAAQAGAWTLLGGLVTGGALALACSSVEDADNCGAAFAGTLVLWTVIGVPATLNLAKTSGLVVKPDGLDKLRAYARFPQGVPQGLDPTGLARAPQGDSAVKR